MKKYLLLISLFIIAVIIELPAQIAFQKCYGTAHDEYGTCVQKTNDGGYIIGGYRLQNTHYNTYLIKTDSNGDTLWTKILGDTTSNICHYVQPTSDGGYIITGEIFEPGNGAEHVYLTKTDSLGNIQWAKSFSTFSEHGCFVNQTYDGGYAIAGVIDSSGTGYNDYLLIKTDSNGSILWAKSYGSPGNNNLYSAEQTNDGGFILAGYSPAMFAGTIYLVKTDSIGNLVWAKEYAGGFDNEIAYSIQQTTDGGYILTGFVNSVWVIDPDVILIKTDSAGTVLWSKTFGGNNGEIGYTVRQTTDGGYAVLGYTASFTNGLDDVYLIKTDSLGGLMWSRSYGSTGNEKPANDGGSLLVQTTDGGYIFTGKTLSFGAGNYDVYLIKTDSLGNSGECYQSTDTTLYYNYTAQSAPFATTTSLPVLTVSSPSTLSSAGGNVTTLCFANVIAETLNLDSFQIYPNPVSDWLTIASGKKRFTQVTLYDLSGKSITVNILPDEKNNLHINCKTLKQGVYILGLQNDKESFYKKIIKLQ